jgi:hypothetical protein
MFESCNRQRPLPDWLEAPHAEALDVIAEPPPDLGQVVRIL